jgi:hypothetical protein
MASTHRKRPHASRELLNTLRQGKETLRRQRERLDLPEKVRVVLERQRVRFPLLRERRSPAEWEQPWAITP